MKNLTFKNFPHTNLRTKKSITVIISFITMLYTYNYIWQLKVTIYSLLIYQIKRVTTIMIELEFDMKHQ